MTKRALVLSICALPFAFACSDDDAPTSDATVANDSGSGTTATVSGVVVSEGAGDDNAPVSGATISVRGSTTQATTDAAGAYSIELPTGQVITVEVAATNLLASLYAFSIPTSGFTDAELSLVLPAAADAAAGDLGVSRDAAKGAVIVEFDILSSSGLAAGDEQASLSANFEASAVFDENAGNDTDAVSGSTLVAGQENGTVLFFNVDPGTTTATISGSGCSADMPANTSFLVEAGKLTWVFATCGP